MGCFRGATLSYSGMSRLSPCFAWSPVNGRGPSPATAFTGEARKSIPPQADACFQRTQALLEPASGVLLFVKACFIYAKVII